VSEPDNKLARVQGTSLVLCDRNQLVQRLEAAGVQRRNTLTLGPNVPVPDGVYYEQRGDRVVVWVPPDPSKTFGRSLIVPRTIELKLRATDDGHQLDVRSVTAPVTRAALGVFAVGVLAILIQLAVSAGIIGLIVFAMPLVAVTVLVRQQIRVAREREALAWDAVAPVVGALPQPKPEAQGPYRR